MFIDTTKRTGRPRCNSCKEVNREANIFDIPSKGLCLLSFENVLMLPQEKMKDEKDIPYARGIDPDFEEHVAVRENCFSGLFTELQSYLQSFQSLLNLKLVMQSECFTSFDLNAHVLFRSLP